MNCFSHAYRFLHADPYFLVGTALPDWLAMVDRGTRVRRRRAVEFAQTNDQATRELARGVVQHHDDDHEFHNNACFVELNLEFAQELRNLLGADAGFRPHLAGHIVIEMLLDGWLMAKDRSRLDLYYEKIASVAPEQVQAGVNRFSNRSTSVLVRFMPRFIREGYLYDYIEDERVRYRLNRVLQRVKLEPLPRTVLAWLPSARKRVNSQGESLLSLSSTMTKPRTPTEVRS